jgi:hypothetical protein
LAMCLFAEGDLLAAGAHLLRRRRKPAAEPLSVPALA